MSTFAIARSTVTRDPQMIARATGISTTIAMMRSRRKYRTAKNILQSLGLSLLARTLAIASMMIYQRRYEQ